MEEKDLGVFGLGIFAAFYCYNDERVNEMKVWFGKWVKEQGGCERVWEEYRDSLPEDTQKEKVIETLEECVKEAIKQGAIKEFDDVLFKRDYKITISADVTDKVYWEVSKKGEPVLLNDDEFKIVSEMVNEINENIKSYLAE